MMEKIVSSINKKLDWGYTDEEVNALKKLYQVARPEMQELIYQLFEDANYHHVCKQLRPEESGTLDAKQIADNFGLSDYDDFMTAFKDTMGEED